MALMSCSRMYMPGAVASGSGSVGLFLPLLVESSCVVFRESSNLSRSTSLMGVCVSLWGLLLTELSPACFFWAVCRALITLLTRQENKAFQVTLLSLRQVSLPQPYSHSFLPSPHCPPSFPPVHTASLPPL